MLQPRALFASETHQSTPYPRAGSCQLPMAVGTLLLGGPQRTPFWDDGAPVFLAPERRGFCMAAGRYTACRDQPVEMRMETTGLHAHFALCSYSSRR